MDNLTFALLGECMHMSVSSEFLKEYQDNILYFPVLIPSLAEKYCLCACLKYMEHKQVYLLQGKRDHKKYILKCVDKISHENLKEEYELQSSLNHQNIASVVEFVEGDKVNYLIREYIEGCTITEYVEMTKDGHLKETDAVKITIQLCDILSYLHNQTPPTIHRDIKPDNVIYTKEGGVGLIDFGISRRYSAKQEKDTVIMGTEYTAPPEQFGYKQTDARSDIYSVGVLLFYMITGSLNINEIDQYDISTDLKNIIGKCTEFSPNDRYSNMKQLEQRLTKQLVKENKNRRWIYTSLGAILTITALFLILWRGGVIKTNQPDAILEKVEHNTVYTRRVEAEVQPDQKQTDMGENTPYVFRSPLIEAAVRQELGLPDSEMITLQALDQIEELYICGEQIYNAWREHFVYGKNQYMNTTAYIESNVYRNQGSIDTLDDIAQMHNIRTLALYNQKISDLTPLMELKHLICLGLGTNNISDISQLAPLKTIQILDLSGNPVDGNDMEVLKDLPELIDLDIGDTNVTGLHNIKQLKLKSLSLYGTDQGDCVGLNEMIGLEKLIICGIGYGITELGMSKVIQLTNLTQLRVMGSQAFDVSIIATMKNLTYLDLCNCNLESIDGLIGLNLQEFYFDGNRVKDLSALEYFPNIQFLGIQNNPIEDYTPLSKLSKLKFLNCNQQQIDKINEQLQEASYQYWIQQ